MSIEEASWNAGERLLRAHTQANAYWKQLQELLDTLHEINEVTKLDNMSAEEKIEYIQNRINREWMNRL